MSVRRFQDCPTCGAELALRVMFLPAYPEDQHVWWDRCTNCGKLLIQPSQALLDRDDGPQTGEFAAAIREYEREEARANAEAVNHPIPIGTVPTDDQHRCIFCAYVCRKGRPSQGGGTAIALWCGYNNEFISDWKGRRVLNPTDADCPDWFPFEQQEGQRCR